MTQRIDLWGAIALKLQGLFRVRQAVAAVTGAITVALTLATFWLSTDPVPARVLQGLRDAGAAGDEKAVNPKAEIAVSVTFQHTTAWSPDGLATLARLQRELIRVPGIDPSSLVSLLTPIGQKEGPEGQSPEDEVEAAALAELEALVRPPVIADGAVREGEIRERWRQKDISWLSKLADLLGLKGRLVSVDGRTVIMRVAMAPPPKPDGPSYGDVFRGLMRAMEQGAQGIHVKLSFAGVPLRTGGLETSLERSWPWLLLLFTMVFAGLWYIARSVPVALMAFIVAAMPVLWMCGGMALLGHNFNPTSWPALMGVFTICVLGCGVGIALYTARLAWGEERDSAARSVMHLGMRLLAPALAAGLLALVPLTLLPGDAARDMVVLGSIGLVLGLGAMLAILPVMLTLLPAPRAWIDDVSRILMAERRPLGGWVLRLADGLPWAQARAFLDSPSRYRTDADTGSIGFPHVMHAFGVLSCVVFLSVGLAGLPPAKTALTPSATSVSAFEAAVADETDAGDQTASGPATATALLDPGENAASDLAAQPASADAASPMSDQARGKRAFVEIEGKNLAPALDPLGNPAAAFDAATFDAGERVVAARAPWLGLASVCLAALAAGFVTWRRAVAIAVAASLAAGMAVFALVAWLSGAAAVLGSGASLCLAVAFGAPVVAALAQTAAFARTISFTRTDSLRLAWEWAGRALIPLALVCAGLWLVMALFATTAVSSGDVAVVSATASLTVTALISSMMVTVFARR